MIRRVVFINNETGERLLEADFRGSNNVLHGIGISDIRGLLPVEANIDSSNFGYMPGSDITSITQGGRSIEFDFSLRPSPGMTIAQMRRNLVKSFLIGSTIHLRFASSTTPDNIERTEDTVYKIEGVVEDISGQIFTEDVNLTMKVFCEKPHFYVDREIVVPGVQAGDSDWIEVPYLGDIDSGFRLNVDYKMKEGAPSPNRAFVSTQNGFAPDDELQGKSIQILNGPGVGNTSESRLVLGHRRTFQLNTNVGVKSLFSMNRRKTEDFEEVRRNLFWNPSPSNSDLSDGYWVWPGVDGNTSVGIGTGPTPGGSNRWVQSSWVAAPTSGGGLVLMGPNWPMPAIPRPSGVTPVKFQARFTRSELFYLQVVYYTGSTHRYDPNVYGLTVGSDFTEFVVPIEFLPGENYYQIRLYNQENTVQAGDIFAVTEVQDNDTGAFFYPDLVIPTDGDFAEWANGAPPSESVLYRYIYQDEDWVNQTQYVRSRLSSNPTIGATVFARDDEWPILRKGKKNYVKVHHDWMGPPNPNAPNPNYKFEMTITYRDWVSSI